MDAHYVQESSPAATHTSRSEYDGRRLNGISSSVMETWIFLSFVAMHGSTMKSYSKYITYVSWSGEVVGDDEERLKRVIADKLEQERQQREQKRRDDEAERKMHDEERRQREGQ